MKNRLPLLLLLLASACPVLPARAAEKPVSLFVAVEGRDANPGTRGKPFATLERARDEIRRLKAAGPLPVGGVTVEVRGGDYYRTNTLEMTEEDSGREDAPIVWRACQGEVSRLLGGSRLNGWRPVTNQAVLARFAPEARPQIRCVDLHALGISDFGEMKSRGKERPIEVAHCELFYGGKPMTLARWPNAPEFLHIAGVPGSLPEGFLYDGERPKAWRASDQIWVHGYWSFDWANSYERVATMDPAKRLVQTAPPFGVYGFVKGQRFYFLNVLEELDQPGEWFLDRKSGVLYFWPPAAGSDPEILLSLLDQPLLKLTDVSNITFRGLTLEATRANAVEIRGGASDRLVGCIIRNIGNAGVIIEGGTGHGVAGCDIFDTGDGGVKMEGGDRQTLAPGGHFVENCHFQRQGRWSKCYVPAIWMSGVGLRASHNLIHDLPHCAILFLGNEHLIEFNEIHHIALETGDVGAIYTGADYSFRGNRIRHNFIHHTGGVGLGSMGVYMDDCASGTEIYGNIFQQANRAVFLGGGRDHRVVNNIFVDCAPAVELDARGLDPSPSWRFAVDKTLRDQLKVLPLELYRRRYPEMKSLDAFYGPPGGPELLGKDFKGVAAGNNTVARNLCVGPWLNLHWLATTNMVTLAGNFPDASGEFVRDPRTAAQAGDFQVKPASKVWRAGFDKIPMHQIGLYTNELRRLMPKGKP